MKKTQLAQPQHKSGKTRAQKDAHNNICRLSRQKMKRRREYLEDVATRYNDMETKYNKMETKYSEMETENQGMKLELEEKNSRIREMENYMQQQRRTNLETQRNEARMRQSPIEWKGQIFSSSDELAKWILSNTNVLDGQASVLNDGNEFVGLGATGTGNLPPYTGGFYQQMGFGQDYFNTASAANHAGPSSAADEFEGPGVTGTGSFPLATADISQQIDFGQDYINTASAAGVWIDSVGSFDASYGGSEFGVPDQLDNFFYSDLAAGFLTHSAAVPSLGANPELPTAHDAGDRSTLASDAAGENPSLETIWEWPL
ncbi:hypothetical protein V6N13_125121 [Hibiscus sabdariffa]|uniref:BZIP domain-containing protein n=1 Tax=Hibiscus sabdariffa TaxID=183260 RepID=A0ABR2U4Z8_9ROSI